MAAPRGPLVVPFCAILSALLCASLSQAKPWAKCSSARGLHDFQTGRQPGMTQQPAITVASHHQHGLVFRRAMQVVDKGLSSPPPSPPPPDPMVTGPGQGVIGTGQPLTQGDTAGLGELCRAGGNIKPIQCQAGLVCEIPPPKGWHHPDFALTGTCQAPKTSVAERDGPKVKQHLTGTAAAEPPTASGNATEGQACWRGGNLMPQDCIAGLVCDAPAPDVGAPGWNPDAAIRGICRAPAPSGALCFNGSTDAKQAPWSIRCAESDALCYVLDPQPGKGSSIVNKSSADSRHSVFASSSIQPASSFTGYCIKKSLVPQLDGTRGSGAAGGVCRLGQPLPNSDSPCQPGLTCLAPSSTVTPANGGSTTYGVCVDGGTILLGLKMNGGASDSTQSGSVSLGTPPPSSAQSPASMRIHNVLPLIAVALACLF